MGDLDPAGLLKDYLKDLNINSVNLIVNDTDIKEQFSLIRSFSQLGIMSQAILLTGVTVPEMSKSKRFAIPALNVIMSDFSYKPSGLQKEVNY